MTSILAVCLKPASWLAIPLALLLLLQWPLRELVQAYSRQANDLAQVLFAVYAACAITAASCAGMHLAAHHHETSKGMQTGVSIAKRWGLFVCIAPWALFVLWVAVPMAWQSLLGLEKFPETTNQGYFIIKLAVLLLLVLALIQVFLTLRKDTPQDPHE